MSYIEKEKLIRADIASIENRVRHAFNQGYDLGFKDGKKRAKPQDQEPIDYKAQYERFSKKSEIVISQLRADRDRLLEVLGKIRAEVENINVWGMRYNPDTDKDRKHQIVQKVKEHVIEIMDKYKVESERKKHG